MKKIFVLLILFISIDLHAQNFVISEYNIDLKIYKNGEITVKEEINVDFKIHRHGIIRKIPIFFRTLSNKSKKLKVYDVDVPGEKFSVDKKENFLYIKIGDKYETLIGPKKYVISYKIFKALEYINDLANFNLVLIGNDWDAEILKGNFYLYLPKEYEIKKQDVYFYSGNFENSIDCIDYSIEKNLLYAKLIRPLALKEGIQLNISIPKNLIKESSLLPLKIFLKENKVIFLPLVTFLILFVIWWFIGKDDIIAKVIHYKLPKDLNPAVVGYVYDDKADNRDLVSLFFYWAKEGIISIEEVEDPLSIFFSKKDYILRQLKPLPIDSKPFEWIIFSELFPSYVNVVRLSSLKNNFYDVMKRSKKSLEDYINSMHLYDKKSLGLRKILSTLAILSFFAGLLIGMRISPSWGISLILSSLIIFFFSLIMPKKTEYGKKVFEMVSGFKEFLEKVEKNKIEKLFSKNPEYFNDILPYAIALGIADKIVSKFSGLFTEPPKYYSYKGREFGNMDSFIVSIDFMLNDLNNFLKTDSESTFDGGGFSGDIGNGNNSGGGSSW